MKTESDSTVTAIFARVLASLPAPVQDDAADAYLALDFSPADRRRMNLIAARAQRGELTARDRQIFENYEQVDAILTLLRSRVYVAKTKLKTGRKLRRAS
jgi:hypothetical protein